jgi:hypothetical protein
VGDWRARKGELRQLPRALGSNDAEVRAVRKAGLDPDLPPPVL